MVVGTLAIAGLGFALSWPNTLFVIEFWELILFGVGWLTAGIYKTEEPGVSVDAVH
jgi:hypothetical protein